MSDKEVSKLYHCLKEYFGFDNFKGNQEAVIRNVLDGNDTFVLMPTGGGKSLCYQLPALMMDGVRFNQLWLRRQTTKFNGVSYVVQRGAAAIFSEEGQRQIRANIDVYRENARVIAQTLAECGVWFTGGENSPYIWFECPNGMDSWDFFDMLLHEANVVGTPGAGFGENGKTFFRLTSLGSPDATKEAMKRVRAFLKK